MKANELMIGDWVLWKDKPVQIARVSGVVYSFGHIDVTLAHCGNGVLETHDIKSISPIPLTPEILEKNGFRRDGGASYWHEGDRDACIIHWSKDKEQLVIGSPCDDCMVKMNIRYIHQLQHALRLCGIEKEIIL